MRDSIVFFTSPTDVVEKRNPPGARLRIGGLVKPGSVARGDNLQVRFAITDGKTDIPVHYQGIVPDLFREGQGVVAEGKLESGGTFAADTVLAKHDERYMPREVVDALKTKRAVAGRRDQTLREHAAMIAELGHYALVLALDLGLIQAIAPIVGARTYDPALMRLANSTAVMQFAFVAFSFASADGLLRQLGFFGGERIREFPLEDAADLQNHQRVGQPRGSMLLWVLILALFGAMVAAFGSNLPATLKAYVLAVQSWIASAFYLFILLTSNPFLRLDQVPSEGRDLNPILQDPGLAIHPPLLYIGYVGFSIAFSFAIAALIEGRIDAAWARWVRPWTLAAWMFLTIGIAMGSYWAYYTLGWGGFWFWDPVENASFMPWLAGTALLHSAVVMEKRNALKIWTILLAILTFSLSLIGTFLVRSGRTHVSACFCD